MASEAEGGTDLSKRGINRIYFLSNICPQLSICKKDFFGKLCVIKGPVISSPFCQHLQRITAIGSCCPNRNNSQQRTSLVHRFPRNTTY